MSYLDSNTFATVVENTPLTSIDLSALPHSKHDEYHWLSAQNLIADDTVHVYVKLSFEKSKNKTNTNYGGDQ